MLMVARSLHNRSNTCQCEPKDTHPHSSTPMRDSDKQGLKHSNENLPDWRTPVIQRFLIHFIISKFGSVGNKDVGETTPYLHQTEG
jgi:hypothetical protein